MACEREGRVGVRSSTSASEPPSSGDEDGGSGRRLVEIELDAARVLVDLAQKSLIGSGSESGGGKSERRLRKWSESGWREESSKGSKASRSTHANLVDDCYGDKASSKVEQNSALVGSGIDCTTSHVSFSGRRVKENLSEAEKEAKRVHRILANRESARQTIRRREALRGELTKKVADLSLENENMKMEKKNAMEEYLSLKVKNKQLKEQMANRISYKVEARGKHARTEVGTSSSSSSKLPLLAYSGATFTPYAWPWPPHCYKECNPPNVGGSRPLFYMPPCGWFYPSIQQIRGYCPPYSHVCRESDETTIGIQQGLGLSSEAMDPIDRTSLPSGHKTEVLLSTAAATERQKNVIGTYWKASSSHRENETLGYFSQTPNTCSFVKDEPLLDVKGESSAGHHDKALSGKSQGVCTRTHKIVDASAVAEARKRRKELTKLKRLLHGRQGWIIRNHEPCLSKIGLFCELSMHLKDWCCHPTPLLI